MAERYVVVLGAGTLRETGGSWAPRTGIDGGVSMRCELSGTHVLHLAVAHGVLDEVFREAVERGVELSGVQVRAEGAVDDGDVEELGVGWSVAIDSPAFPEEAAALITAVDPVVELPEALHSDVAVWRVGHG